VFWDIHILINPVFAVKTCTAVFVRQIRIFRQF